MKVLNIIAHFHNWVSDKDFIWWPFSFLRPEPQEMMTFKQVCFMTLCFGGLSFTMFTIYAVVNNASTPSSIASTFSTCFGGFFVWFSVVTKPLWNSRARNLR